jgi:precorrin-3B synthase
MESGDGLLVRVRARHGARGIRASDVRAVAQLAAAHGNGLLEVTRRARLQVRGVRAESLAALQRAIVELGLAADCAELEQSADALIVNPWSGLSPACAELDAIAGALERAFAQSRVCEGASSKLGIVLDSGYALLDIAADIHVNVEAERVNRASIHVASGVGRWSYLLECDVADVARTVVALLSGLRESSCERIRELVDTVGVDALRERSNIRPHRSDSTKTLHFSKIGAPGGDADTREWLEFGLPFGAGDPTSWAQLALIAEGCGSNEVRVTPFRTVIVLGVAREQRTAALELAKAAGWITDPSDPLLRVAACPGAPKCTAGAGETRTFARELAPLLGAGESLHVSGCAKGCAQNGAASITVVRRADGCNLGFGLTTLQTAETARLSLPETRAVLAGRAHPSQTRTLARDPSTVQARELR